MIVLKLNEALESARQEVRRLHEERDHYEEAMKKAFMRGVCALNLEAMTMFQEPEGKNGTAAGGNLPSAVIKHHKMGDLLKLSASLQTTANVKISITIFSSVSHFMLKFAKSWNVIATSWKVLSFAFHSQKSVSFLLSHGNGLEGTVTVTRNLHCLTPSVSLIKSVLDRIC